LFESIADYRERIGKAKEDLTETDYALVAVRALEAAGFKAEFVHASVSYYPMEDPELKKAYRQGARHTIGLSACPADEAQEAARQAKESK
jgi:hypothetical protein